MTAEKLKSLEPLFGSWYVESKIGQGRNSAFFRVTRNENGLVRRMGIKTLRFPESDHEISRVIASGKYQTVGEYLEQLEKTVRHNLQKMLALRGNPNIIRFDDFEIVKESSCFYAIILMEQLTPLSEVFKADTQTELLGIRCQKLQFFDVGCDDLLMGRPRTEGMTVQMQHGILDADGGKELKPAAQDGRGVDLGGTEADLQPQMSLREGEVVLFCVSAECPSDLGGCALAFEQHGGVFVGQLTDGKTAAFHGKHHVLGRKIDVKAGPDTEKFGMLHDKSCPFIGIFARTKHFLPLYAIFCTMSMGVSLHIRGSRIFLTKNSSAWTLSP